jgi:hypothetical protein
MPRVVGLQLLAALSACALSARAEVFVRKQTPKTLLTKVPVFLLTNEAGQPYLTSTPQGDQVGKMFLFLKDAQKSLQDLKRMPGASDARMWKTDLHRAMRMAQRAQLAGYSPDGRELRMLMRLAPHTRQRTNARMLQARQGKLFAKVPELPIFVAEGLAAQKGGSPVVPLFFSKEELDRVWNRVALRADSALPAKPRVTVTSLSRVMQAVEDDPSMRVDFYIGEATQQWVKEQRRPGRARILRSRIVR